MAFGANSRNSTPIAAGDVSSSRTSRPTDRSVPSAAPEADATRARRARGLGVDDSSTEQPSPARPFSSTREMLHHIGWHSILNLAIAQHGVALIGSFGSAWSQVTLQMMHQHFGGPVLGCSLRPGWKNDNLCAHALRSTPRGRATRPHHICFCLLADSRHVPCLHPQMSGSSSSACSLTHTTPIPTYTPTLTYYFQELELNWINLSYSRHCCATSDTRFTPPGRLQRAFPVTEQCRREMARLCRGGDFMYEGNFSY
jgi:hypothetical protein